MVQVRGAEGSNQGGSNEGREEWIFLKKFETGIYLLYNAMSTSAAQQSESATLDMSWRNSQQKLGVGQENKWEMREVKDDSNYY